MTRRTALFGLGIVGALMAAAPAAADTLVDNVNGISVDRAGHVTRFTAMVIDDRGRVAQVLTPGTRAPRTEFREDGRGHTVIPGLIDAHLHVMAFGLAQLTLDLTGTRTLAEALDKIAAYAAANPERPWIVGRGWNQELWGLGRFPTAAELDAVVGDRPVWLERIDGHAGWANSAAMKLAGISAATANPPGGRITRRGTGKAPDGVFIDAARDLVAAKVPAARPEDMDLALAKAQDLLLRHGVTAVADMGTALDDWMTYRRAGDLDRLRIRIMAYARSVPEMIQIGGPGPTPWLYDDRLRMGGLKLFLDGALGSRGALLKAAYTDDPGNKGNALLSGTQLRNLMSRAAMDDFQVAIHAIGDAANAEALDAVDELSADYAGDRRWRIEHAQVVDPADIARFGQHGIVASMQPVHQTSDRLMAEARLGAARLTGAYAWKSLSAAGAHLAFGSDAPVEEPDPLTGIAVAVSRRDAAGDPAGGWHPEEIIGAAQALAAYTSGAAYAGFAEDRFGELKTGQRADFVVLDGDPLVADGTGIRALHVLETWVGGQKAFAAAPRAVRAVDTPGR
ncbi:MAG: amidohydrolase family protein [Croceibacterium sp.]